MVEIKASVFADVLFEQFVETTKCKISKGREINFETLAAFNSKVRLYQFSAVLMALTNEKSRDPAFGAVIEYLEIRFFPTTFQQSANMLHDVRVALNHLAVLIYPNEEHKWMTWSLEWLANVGIDEDNPVNLHLFGIQWFQLYIMVQTTLQEARIV